MGFNLSLSVDGRVGTCHWLSLAVPIAKMFVTLNLSHRPRRTEAELSSCTVSFLAFFSFLPFLYCPIPGFQSCFVSRVVLTFSIFYHVVFCGPKETARPRIAFRVSTVSVPSSSWQKGILCASPGMNL